ncbi:hypothetical protein [Amycolatopsis regifaucium]|uniref:Uncharacterized protein n=1 Tax=Amycolatopsis regifaucium TaxID=546365 RepID=A0A154MTI1_9PSEU|nr:hypothetical protein [Amycolatopsis regifaucium]KZB87654.1 hypothetical protein AVL48_23905 [Amycolatopsis regifaucium]OKA05478.1 hypothetical protein ATP06_0225620 [Amycolatopsis regifaucium]SFI12062.1 hypothetical protein SAMN04489731_108258 [Amycolatopsis regifaucium]
MTVTPQPLTARQRGLLVLLSFDAFLLGLLELFFLPLRLDGIVLPKLGDAPIPLTVVLAVLTTPLLVMMTAKVIRPSFSVIPLLVWVLVVLVMGVTGPGGDLVLVQDWRALLLIGGGALPGALALGGGLGRAAKAGKGGNHG